LPVASFIFYSHPHVCKFTADNDTAKSDNVETLRITKKFLGHSKILDGHQKHRVSEARKPKVLSVISFCGRI